MKLNPMSEPPEGEYKERTVLVVREIGEKKRAVSTANGWYSRTANQWVLPHLVSEQNCLGWIEAPTVEISDEQ
ncbi:hypothetical protein [Allohahella sp. A8]|uniref:hypothetical protein n=1 Tax=Allohahella sp. A8 TaxID=3141461 RepID=UPI003A811F8C